MGGGDPTKRHKTRRVAAKEEAVLDVFSAHGMLYRVDITFENGVPLTNFPWIKPSSFLRALARQNDFSHLLGGHRCLEDAKDALDVFWSRFWQICPQHDVFKAVGDGRIPTLSRCLPLYIHGDEGTTYRRSGVLVVSFQGAFGYGCSKRRSHPDDSLVPHLRLNFLKTGFQTSLVCPKDRVGIHDESFMF